MRMNDHENTATDYARSRKLRNNASPCEKKLWAALRGPAAKRGLKLRRQQAIHPFIADFACMEAKLLVELDGESHDARQNYDRARENFLKQKGYSILRFSNDDIKQDAEGAALTILAQAETLIHNTQIITRLHSPLPNPPREGEGTTAVLADEAWKGNAGPWKQ